jgi:hypothetical protein
VLKKNGVLNGKVWASINESIKIIHAMPRDSFSSCLKDRTSEQRLTTLEMRRNYKQKLEHKVSQSTPYGELVPTFGFSRQRKRKELPS